MEGKQTAMRKLLTQLKDERTNLPMPIEWDRCYQSIEMVIESTYLSMEKEQIKSDFHNSVVAMAMGRIMTPEQYYKETYGTDQSIEKLTD